LLIDGIDNAKNDEIARLCCYFLARFNEQGAPQFRTCCR
jgi:hypothetical protein